MKKNILTLFLLTNLIFQPCPAMQEVTDTFCQSFNQSYLWKTVAFLGIGFLVNQSMPYMKNILNRWQNNVENPVDLQNIIDIRINNYFKKNNEEVERNNQIVGSSIETVCTILDLHAKENTRLKELIQKIEDESIAPLTRKLETVIVTLKFLNENMNSLKISNDQLEETYNSFSAPSSPSSIKHMKHLIHSESSENENAKLKELIQKIEDESIIPIKIQLEKLAKMMVDPKDMVDRLKEFEKNAEITLQQLKNGMSILEHNNSIKKPTQLNLTDEFFDNDVTPPSSPSSISLLRPESPEKKATVQYLHLPVPLKEARYYYED